MSKILSSLTTNSAFAGVKPAGSSAHIQRAERSDKGSHRAAYYEPQTRIQAVRDIRLGQPIMKIVRVDNKSQRIEATLKVVPFKTMREASNVVGRMDNELSAARTLPIELRVAAAESILRRFLNMSGYDTQRIIAGLTNMERE